MRFVVRILTLLSIINVSVASDLEWTGTIIAYQSTYSITPYKNQKISLNQIKRQLCMPDTWLIMDYDETIVTNRGDTVVDPEKWGKCVEFFDRSGINYKKILLDETILINERIKNFIKDVQLRVPVMILTARTEFQWEEVKELGLSDERAEWNKKGLFGGYCTSGTDKGIAFVNYLNYYGIKPKRVIFMDDHVEYLKQVAMALESMCDSTKTDIEYFGYECTYSKDIKKDVWPKLSDEEILWQINYFKNHQEWIHDFYVRVYMFAKEQYRTLAKEYGLPSKVPEELIEQIKKISDKSSTFAENRFTKELPGIKASIMSWIEDKRLKIEHPDETATPKEVEAVQDEEVDLWETNSQNGDKQPADNEAISVDEDGKS